MSKIDDIINGWKNYLVGSDVATLELAKHRATICVEDCDASTYGLHTAVLPDYSINKIEGMYCDKSKGGCGCPLSTAVRSENYKCPKNKW